jgi:SAM-dependent methyltransferase
VLGDGDGRFLARLMRQNPQLRADAVDTSEAMLALLREHCRMASPDADRRLTTHRADAVEFVSQPAPTPACDLAATHFFLDCLTQAEVEALAHGVQARLTDGALWVVSDFCVPAGAMRLPAKLLVRGLYLAFRILTGLRVDRLPDHAAALSGAGFLLNDRYESFCGFLFSELWRRGG